MKNCQRIREGRDTLGDCRWEVQGWVLVERNRRGDLTNMEKIYLFLRYKKTVFTVGISVWPIIKTSKSKINDG